MHISDITHSPKLISVKLRQGCRHHQPIGNFPKKTQGSVPEDWRIDNVCQIFKTGSRGKASNYRPVSLTSQVCKIYESISRDAIVEHLVKKSVTSRIATWIF